jgi:hypothetical protein
MSTKQKPDELNDVAVADRRTQSCEEPDSADWETIVLRRMADRVKSLSDDPLSPSQPSRDLGWEEAALLALRRRIRHLESK